jgi:hypothetical protein
MKPDEEFPAHALMVGLESDWRLPALEKNATETEAWLLALLQKRILALLEDDFSRLYQALYRIDVPEILVKQAFEEANDLPTLAQYLAKLVLERQKLKLRTREAYKKQQAAESSIKPKNNDANTEK